MDLTRPRLSGTLPTLAQGLPVVLLSCDFEGFEGSSCDVIYWTARRGEVDLSLSGR